MAVAVVVVLALVGLGAAAVYYGLQDRAANEKQVAAEHYQKGLAQMDAGQWELAVAEFELVLKLDPDNSEANSALAQARAQLEVQPTATPCCSRRPAPPTLTNSRRPTTPRTGSWWWNTATAC
jgi:Tfp pilus assembly protein PilF